MKTVYALAVLTLAASASVGIADERQVHVLTFTNKGCIFQLESTDVSGDAASVKAMTAEQSLIVQYDLPREMPIEDEKLKEVYYPIWDSLRSSVRLKMTLWDIGIQRQDASVITWRTNGTPSANSALIHCSNEQERQRVAEAVRSLFGSCSSTKERPTVTVNFEPLWPQRIVRDAAQAERVTPTTPATAASPTVPQSPAAITNPLAKASLNLMRVNIEEMERNPNPSPQLLEMIRSQRRMLGAYEELFQALDATK